MPCVEPVPAAAVAPCGVAISQDEEKLCAGLHRVATTRCTALQDPTILAHIIRSIGLVNDRRGCQLYGEFDCAFMNTKSVVKAGIYQSPWQLAQALVNLSTLNIQTYLELGIHTAWTTALIVSVLGRFATIRRGDAVDIRVDRVSNGTRTALQLQSTAVHTRVELWRILVTRQDRIDLCFVDGDHSLQGVSLDYELLKPFCRHFMFHDVVDAATSRSRSKGGGVPAFWAQLKTEVDASRVREFVEQPHGVGAPVFGIGVLLATENVAGRGMRTDSMPGFCSVTSEEDDGNHHSGCATGHKGSWRASHAGIHSLDACAARCARCARCRYVSFSLVADDCSWYLECDLDHLTPDTTLPAEFAGTFVTMAMQAKQHKRAQRRSHNLTTRALGLTKAPTKALDGKFDPISDWEAYLHEMILPRDPFAKRLYDQAHLAARSRWTGALGSREVPN